MSAGGRQRLCLHRHMQPLSAATPLESGRAADEATRNQNAGQPPLILWNYANLSAYVLNFVITYVSLTGVFGATNTVLSQKYQTLITPAGAAFSIWGVIFIAEGVFVVAQMLPQFRGSKLVQAVAPWWCAACIFQVVWTISFAQEVIILSLLCMFGILLTLIGAMWMADQIKDTTVSEYWLLRAGFSVHAGWILAAAAVNSSVWLDSMKATAPQLLSTAIASLAAVFTISALYAVAVRKPDAIICLVVAWATGFIYLELRNPTNLQSTTRFNPIVWDPVVLDGVGGAALTISVAALGMAGVALALRLLPPAARGAPQPEGGKYTDDEELRPVAAGS